MKKTIVIACICMSAISFLSFLPGECGMYAPSKEGTVLEMKSYNDNDKLNSSSRLQVVSVRNTDKGQEIQMEAESFDKKDKPVGKSNYAVTCESGNFYVDMKSMVSQEQMANFKDMQVSIQADRLDIPSDPQPGQTLQGGNVEINSASEGSPITMKLTMNISNRKVAGIENVTVPAGTFKCVKITYDVESKILIKVRTKAVDWYAKDVGLVRSETYNTKDKLMGYTVLASKK
jgi:hypothetical protein